MRNDQKRDEYEVRTRQARPHLTFRDLEASIQSLRNAHKPFSRQVSGDGEEQSWRVEIDTPKPTLVSAQLEVPISSNLAKCPELFDDGQQKAKVRAMVLI